MGTITLEVPSSGTVVSAGLHAANYADIQAVINGGLENSNINASAAIDLTKLAAEAWSTYTPSWTSSGTAPSLGNGTLTGRYTKIGRLASAEIVLIFGTTTTPGTGIWNFSLPVGSRTAFQLMVSTIYGFRSGVGTGFQAFVRSNATATGVGYLYVSGSPSGALTDVVGGAAPWAAAWASADAVSAAFTYETS
jgi:hypothetical protein